MNYSKHARWTGALPAGFQAEPAFATRPSAPRELPPSNDLVKLLFAEDARSQQREIWLGLAWATVTVGLFASGAGIPVLATAFCLAPAVGIGLEIFAPSDRHNS